MKTCYINVSPEQVKDSLQMVKDKNPDSVLVLAPVRGIEMMSPTKKKPFHRVKVEVVVPEDGVIGNECLGDLGVIVTLRVPQNRINPEYLKLIDKPDKEIPLIAHTEEEMGYLTLKVD